jgi:hypothetical protein
MQFAAKIKQAGYRDALLLGMGGSSRRQTCSAARSTRLDSRRTLDSTDPAQSPRSNNAST